MKDSEDAKIEALLHTYKPAKTILSTVINHNSNLEKILSGSSSFHKLSAQTKLPFNITVDKPETMGADRLALAAAAVHFYKGKNNLVIASGSCITYNFINQYDNFLGGSISPGMDMRFTSMNAYTAKLPLINVATKMAAFNFPLIGYDTRTNMISGVIMGIAAEIDGIIKAYHEKFDNLHVILTGGNASYFLSHIKSTITADVDLIFKGLYAISEANQ